MYKKEEVYNSKKEFLRFIYNSKVWENQKS